MAEQWQRRRQILSVLNEQKTFVSGEDLAKQLGVTRATISNHIDALEQAGVGIYSVKGKGYKLEKPVPLIDGDALVHQIDNRCFYFDEIDSTNSFVLKHAEELKSGDICIAEYQSAGRGRRGRKWASPYGSHLYASMLWQFPQGMAQAMGLSLVVGCSLTAVLEKLGLSDVAVKWPNDVYLEGKKLAGILVEMSGQVDGECQVVIGTGVNLSMPTTAAEQIGQPWADIVSQQTLPDKTEFAIALHQQLKADIQAFEQSGLSAFVERWQQVDLYCDKPIKLLMADNVVEGICRGIDAQGALLLEVAGEVKAFVGGEITVRKVRLN
ncbi:bifunctional biotin--[acetyl-CoA-carboxylase] ligase/biotin operon repressor BirA [Parashewanella spongiae]|uniref:Bifunctional ligase/repressor BirA n=1 Tax=Parashewanella spongiae TaxID=342950 RepID=A0A3A6TMY5_9GAMM|nr:bifunctional biotin--[acetyl-CoA-carboxylase] ligase/biotin operon repressor BirA [Parashewanella spongiae]MCL1080005.1 bifunctional biotin--[acetyl-CoA-carboxylase] ligase/biotin operon repressor BirA [Parashewanella spongiae]RJY06000.1 bifunctional biotin--[acetyl-CoA-carboxylase] ligase/biotin operon repressor BirA [Parashewanella spongiae]